MAKVLIPTPLRQFTGKQDRVEAAGATVGEVLSALTTEYPDLRKQIFNDEGKLRSFVNVYLNDEDIRYLNRTDTPAEGRRFALAGSFHRGRLHGNRATRRGGAHQGRDPALQPAPDHSRSGHRRPAEAESGQGAAGGRRRLGRSSGPVSDGGGHRPHRHRGFRRGRLHQPATPGDPFHRRRGPQETGFGGGEDEGHQSGSSPSSNTKRRFRAKTRSRFSKTTTSWWTAPTTFPRAIW